MSELQDRYLMEHADEAKRLDIKTDPQAVRSQARLCGIHPGARVLDAGCGSGKTTAILHEFVGPSGKAVGVDIAESRVAYARQNYGGKPGLTFECADINKSLDSLGEFDFIWVRFVLEYYKAEARDIIKGLTRNLAPDGRLCLLDLDHNSLNHYPFPEDMEPILQALLARLEAESNFDPYIGRKLYTYLYDMRFRNLEVHMLAHHLIYGALRAEDAYNWTRKLRMSAGLFPDLFKQYPDGLDGYFDDFDRFFSDPRRFTYTPLVICTGLKPR